MGEERFGGADCETKVTRIEDLPDEQLGLMDKAGQIVRDFAANESARHEVPVGYVERFKKKCVKFWGVL